MDLGIGHKTGSVSAGFTLIELLVAIAVLATLAVGASLVATRSAGGGSEAARFERNYLASRQLAVGGQQMRGIAITPRDFQPMRYGADGWQALGRAIRWQDRVSLAPRGGPQPVGWPEIVFLPDGRSSAFSIRFGAGRSSIACESDGWTGLTCDGG